MKKFLFLLLFLPTPLMAQMMDTTRTRQMIQRLEFCMKVEAALDRPCRTVLQELEQSVNDIEIVVIEEPLTLKDMQFSPVRVPRIQSYSIHNRGHNRPTIIILHRHSPPPIRRDTLRPPLYRGTPARPARRDTIR